MMAKAKDKVDENMKVIQLPRPKIGTIRATLLSDSSLVLHGWDPAVIQKIEDDQGGKPKNKKPPKDPTREWHGTLYPMDAHGGYTADVQDPDKHKTGFGIKGSAIKKCMVEAAYQMLGQKKTWARCGFHIMEDYIRIEGTPTFRRDMVRLKGTIDMRYRAEYKEWKMSFTIRYDDNVIHDGQLYNMLANGGFGIGLGDWRVQCNGNHGMFHLAEEQ
jgi:hypothetical protein